MSPGIFFVLLAAILCWFRLSKRVELAAYALYSLAFAVAVVAHQKPDSDIAVYASVYEQLGSGYFAYNHDHAFWALLFVLRHVGLEFDWAYGAIVAASHFALMASARIVTGKPGGGFLFSCIFLALPVGVLLPKNLLRQYAAAAVCIPAVLFLRRPWLALPLFNLHFSSVALLAFRSRALFYGIAGFVLFTAAVVSILDLSWLGAKIEKLSERDADALTMGMSVLFTVVAVEMTRRLYGRDMWWGYARIASIPVLLLALDPYIAYRAVLYPATLACVLLPKWDEKHYLVFGSLLIGLVVHLHRTTLEFWGAVP